MSMVETPAIDFYRFDVVDAGPAVTMLPAVSHTDVHPVSGRGSEPEVFIRTFSNTWTYVKRLIRDNETVGWEFRCMCGHHRKYTLAHFNDPYATAVKARDTHECAVS